MKRRYMAYLYEPKKIPRTTLHRMKRVLERQQHVLGTEAPVESVPGVLLPGVSLTVINNLTF